MRRKRVTRHRDRRRGHWSGGSGRRRWRGSVALVVAWIYADRTIRNELDVIGAGFGHKTLAHPSGNSLPTDTESTSRRDLAAEMVDNKVRFHGY